MWTRSLLKANAKQALSGRYWRSVLLCALLGLIGIGDVVSKTTFQFRYEMDKLSSIGEPEVWSGNNSAADLYSSFTVSPVLASIIAFVGIFTLALSLCWLFFLVSPLVVGRNRYFMESRQAITPLRSAVSAFRTPYLNVVKVMALTYLKVTLGYLIIVPGIYWSYCYRQVPYLLAENPYLPVGRAMELSRQMMDGEKWNTFVLDLSFIGWVLLGALTAGIGYIFLEPYMQATFAELYAALRSKALAAGMTDSNELGGFVRHAEGSQLF